ncbi:transporter [Dyella telluris]|uniref:Transporter n=1 Tax=Dyella telluris TaxID=2763498 RepID=A0A7G8Q649_9GAMM|nr:transporter [Dyella telluris]
MGRSLAYRAVLFASAFGLLLLAGIASAQELEPRAYSASPIGTNFIDVGYTRLSGDVLTDPSLPITNVQAQINAMSAAYVRSFGLAGHSATLAVGLPYVDGSLSGNVIDAPSDIHRSGMGDLKLRFGYNILGSPALTPEEFARRTPTASLGVSLTISAPTGQYTPDRLVNIGTNRWAFKPEIGISKPFGKWFLEASAGAYFFTSNEHFYGDKVRTQDPLAVVQLHGGYTFRPGLWVAADIGYVDGGGTSLDGVAKKDKQSNARYGLTCSAPLARGWSAKVALSNGLVTRVGGDYQSITFAVQYRWFDR